MTSEAAIEIAMNVAKANGWAWMEPVSASVRRQFFLFGRARWQVTSHADCIGGNVWITIEDSTGAVLHQGFASR